MKNDQWPITTRLKSKSDIYNLCQMLYEAIYDCQEIRMSDQESLTVKEPSKRKLSSLIIFKIQLEKKLWLRCLLHQIEPDWFRARASTQSISRKKEKRSLPARPNSPRSWGICQGRDGRKMD